MAERKNDSLPQDYIKTKPSQDIGRPKEKKKHRPTLQGVKDQGTQDARTFGVRHLAEGAICQDVGEGARCSGV